MERIDYGLYLCRQGLVVACVLSCAETDGAAAAMCPDTLPNEVRSVAQVVPWYGPGRQYVYMLAWRFSPIPGVLSLAHALTPCMGRCRDVPPPLAANVQSLVRLELCHRVLRERYHHQPRPAEQLRAPAVVQPWYVPTVTALAPRACR